MKLYCITANLQTAARALERGVDMLQIRAKDLEGRAFLKLAEAICALPNPGGTKILVNTRTDIALVAGAHGVHLPAGSPSPRAIVPRGFLIGCSCHTIAEILAAEQDGADLVVFGPIFPTSSKPDAEALSLATLKEACQVTRLPVFALGGITAVNAEACVRVGAAGVAGISMFEA